MKLEHRRGAEREWQSPGQIEHSQNVGDWNESGQGLPPGEGAATVSHISPSSVPTAISSPAGRLALELDTCHLVFVGLHLQGHTPGQARMKKGHRKGADRKRRHLPFGTPSPPWPGCADLLGSVRAGGSGG